MSRYPPSVIATATVAAAASIYFIHSCVARFQHAPSGSLHRSNAIRRSYASSRRSDSREADNVTQGNGEANRRSSSALGGSDEAVIAFGNEGGHNDRDMGPADVAETENSIDPSTENHSASPTGTRLQELVYAIAKNASEQEGIVHRGISCDKCHKLPIVGVRYHCVNCPDFDLCEDCEATDCHLKTHVFYKVKIPSPWAGKSPLPVWYPGDPTRMPHNLENGPFKNSLASKTGFSHNKIDGLYQQFSCMANVKTAKSPGMGIDRMAFDTCFIGQTMTERPSAPNLVHDRLFTFYDQNNDGVVDFEEFVVGTSLVHSKDKTKREKRIFRGLDLDNDNFIDRRDCLKMFRAFYSLNKDMMLGYIRVEREGENGDLARVRRDPRDHLMHGRPLASFFDDNPSFSPRIHDVVKPKDAIGEEVEALPTIQLFQEAETTEDWDLITQEDVSQKAYFSLWTVFNDEMFRLCVGKPMKWLTNGTHARTFHHKSRSHRREDLIEDESGALWAADATYYGKTAYLRLDQSDIERANTSETENGEKSFYDYAHNYARTRLCFLVIRRGMRLTGKRRFYERNERERFFLGDRTETNTPAKSREDTPLHVLDETLQDSGSEETTAAQTAVPFENGSIWQPREQSPTSRNFIGGTAAAHTIYKVVEEALNELLDPLFRPAEYLALDVEASQIQREKHARQINAHLNEMREDMFKGVPDAETLADPSRTQDARDQAVRDFSVKVTSENIRNAEMLHLAYAAWSATYSSVNYIDSANAKEHFLTWLIEMEASMQLENNPPDDRVVDPPLPEGSYYIHQVLASFEERDPTMPQNRPTLDQESTKKDEDDDNSIGKVLSQEELSRLTTLEAVARNNKIKIGTGLLDFADFMRKLELTEENGDKLLQWIGNWVDLIMF